MNVYVPKSVNNFCYSEKKNGIPIKVLNALKRLSIVEHLVNNSTCEKIYK